MRLWAFTVLNFLSRTKQLSKSLSSTIYCASSPLRDALRILFLGQLHRHPDNTEESPTTPGYFRVYFSFPRRRLRSAVAEAFPTETLVTRICFESYRNRVIWYTSPMLRPLLKLSIASTLPRRSPFCSARYAPNSIRRGNTWVITSDIIVICRQIAWPGLVIELR